MLILWELLFETDSNVSLNSILWIRISEISMQTFHSVYVDKCVK